MDKKIAYWVELSDYDLDTAKAMLKTGRYLYVGFMCHQSVEKMLKAFFISVISEIPPYSHSLSYLAKKANLYDSLPADFQDMLDLLDPLNIEARYPSHKEKLMQSLTRSKCQQILEDTIKIQTWIKEKL